MSNILPFNQTMDLTHLQSFFTEAVILINKDKKPLKVKLDKDLKKELILFNKTLERFVNNG